MSAAPKLSDERVREILRAAIDSSAAERKLLGASCKGVARMGGLTCPELEALAQAVIDLRTANGMLEARIEQLEAECVGRCVGREVIAAGGDP
ncbi:MAG TPA: hypothetical protein VGH28_14065 [Polyangiaceae bacterium]|jgi:BMFP domain-containing protein YqiC